MNAYPVDLNALYSRCAFRSPCRVAYHEETAREFAEHRLRWYQGGVDTVLYKARLCEIGVYLLRYGAEVEVMPRPSNDFIVVHWSLRGLVELVCDGQRAILRPGQTSWMSPRRSWNMRWQAGSEQLILKIPNRLASHSGRSELGEATFSFLPSRLQPQWLTLIQALLTAIADPLESDGYNEWSAHLERLVVDFLSLGMSNPSDNARTAGHLQSRPSLRSAASNESVQPIERMEKVVVSRLGSNWSLDDLADAAGVSPRVLQTLCLRERKMSPTDLLRNMRLDAARRRLQTSSVSSVTETAMEMGFAHLGRFSSYYRERFGELPSETFMRRFHFLRQSDNC
ncbi:AraC family transcriptional regulator [Paraburkholderia strydomiana]